MIAIEYPEESYCRKKGLIKAIAKMTWLGVVSQELAS